ncbi:MAG: hypothetical protein MRERV_36c013 [Mycoplasmataceae bacterium RV_VA103A]|nr:MAG: hypothetical protein MRERV_36c013 [Mycoplasmataceae bacterium RV_VA103A]
MQEVFISPKKASTKTDTKRCTSNGKEAHLLR